MAYQATGHEAADLLCSLIGSTPNSASLTSANNGHSVRSTSEIVQLSAENTPNMTNVHQTHLPSAATPMNVSVRDPNMNSVQHDVAPALNVRTQTEVQDSRSNGRTVS